MAGKTPKEQLAEQLKRLKLDDDLKYMLEEGIRKMSDDEAFELTTRLKAAIFLVKLSIFTEFEVITGILKEIIRQRPDYVAPANSEFRNLEDD